jgi:hypothetical protein
VESLSSSLVRTSHCRDDTNYITYVTYITKVFLNGPAITYSNGSMAYTRTPAGSLQCNNKQNQISFLVQLYTLCEKFSKQRMGDDGHFPISSQSVPQGTPCFPKCVGTENLNRSLTQPAFVPQMCGVI